MIFPVFSCVVLKYNWVFFSYYAQKASVLLECSSVKTRNVFPWNGDVICKMTVAITPMRTNVKIDLVYLINLGIVFNSEDP